MKENKSNLVKITGWILFFLAVGFFCIQMGYFLVHARYQVEYIDNRLFFIINILCMICLAGSIFLLLKLTKMVQLIVLSVLILFSIVNVNLLVKSKQEVNNITSLSPDWKHVLSIKEDVERGVAVYYRSYFGIMGRPREALPHKTAGDFKVEWLEKDVAAVTYKTDGDTIQQFIGTYGDRGTGTSYYYVGAEIHGQWKAKDYQVESTPEGIFVTEKGKTEMFEWENIIQFGTLAVVLKKNDEAVWTIALNEDFKVHSDPAEPTTGNIILYKATMKNNQLITLEYKTVN